MISIREEITIASPPEAVWPLLSDPAVVASCIPGATLTKAGASGAYQGTMRVKFGPTVAQFRGEARLTYDHAARRCSIEGRGIDGRGASRANASGAVEASGTDTTVLKVEGDFNVTGPLETFANAGGVHVARAILAEFAENAPKVRFAQDSPLEGGVTCELVSVSKFPVSRENTGNFIDSELSGASTRAKKAINSMRYEPIPYASEQGIF